MFNGCPLGNSIVDRRVHGLDIPRLYPIQGLLVRLEIATLGGMDFLPIYPIFGLKIEPYGMLVVPFVHAMTTLILLRYDVENISVFVKRAVAFILITLVMLGTPVLSGLYGEGFLRFWLGDMWWMAPMAFALVLALLSPLLLGWLYRSAPGTFMGSDADIFFALNLFF